MKETIRQKTTMLLGPNRNEELDYSKYYTAVYHDFAELKKEYPYSYLSIPPTSTPSLAQLIVVAVNACTIAYTRGSIDDFTESFSRKLRVEIPLNYQQAGCKVYGGKWINIEKIKKMYRHFNGSADKDGNHCFCVGVPESFITMDNVLLECVRTADNMLTAYRKYLSGKTKGLDLLAYSHGTKGELEYEQYQKKKRKCK